MPFANNNLCVINLAFPDVCNTPTPVGPIPVPMVNIAFSCTHIPSVINVIIGGGMAENLMTFGTLSDFDEAGAAMGVASGTIIGPDHAVVGSFKALIGPAPGTKMLSITIQNTVNAPGASLSPGQVQVMILS